MGAGTKSGAMKMEHKRMHLRDVEGKNQQDWMNDLWIVNRGCVSRPLESFKIQMPSPSPRDF